MGFMKRRLEEMEERLFLSSWDHVCKHHVHEEWLRSQLKSTLVDDPCVVCGATNTGQIQIDELLDRLAATIRCHWRRAIDDLYLDPETESGFALAPVADTEDLVRNEMHAAIDESLLETVVGRLVDEQWYDPQSLWLEGSELLTFSWRQFSEWSKEHPSAAPSATYGPDFGAEAADGISPEQVLARLHEIVVEFDLITARDIPWFRACVLDVAEAPTAARLGTAPAHVATRSNRNSPAGVSMFYGAFDDETARQEVGDPEAGSGRVVVVGKWKATRPLVLLDLTKEPELPSFYDVGRSAIRQGLIFLREFASEVSQPLGAADPIVAYRPTQALTAFMRAAIEGLDGIVYRSSLTGRACCTLFVSNDQCLDDTPHPPSGLSLVLTSINASALG